jgi:hypothetical protein
LQKLLLDEKGELSFLEKDVIDKLSEYESAVDVYNKALEVAPDFLWIKNILLPAAENKLNMDN